MPKPKSKNNLDTKLTSFVSQGYCDSGKLVDQNKWEQYCGINYRPDINIRKKGKYARIKYDFSPCGKFNYLSDKGYTEVAKLFYLYGVNSRHIVDRDRLNYIHAWRTVLSEHAPEVANQLVFIFSCPENLADYKYKPETDIKTIFRNSKELRLEIENAVGKEEYKLSCQLKTSLYALGWRIQEKQFVKIGQ